MGGPLQTVLALVQLLLGTRVLLRLLRSAGGRPIERPAPLASTGARLSVLLPVLNEQERLGPCLEGLIEQGAELAEVLLLDGGSTDGTRALVRRYMARDPRLRWVDASRIPAGWNGKAWALQVGLEQSAPGVGWLLTMDADVRARPGLVGALLATARARRLPGLSVATRQEIEGAGLGLLHPALLTTLVYRFGIPGQTFRRVEEVVANGQCFLIRRQLLHEVGGFGVARRSRCDDITTARLLVSRGYRLGFFEAGGLVVARMHRDWRDAWNGWPRSLPARDQFSNGVTGLWEVTLVQALPLPLTTLLLLRGRGSRLLRQVNLILVALRLGVLLGTTRAYSHRPWSYWLSPLCDIPVALKLWASARQRRPIWRGRRMVQER